MMSEYHWHDLGNGRQVYRKVAEPPKARADLPAPMVMSDTLPEPVQSMADGKYYSSKAALRATYKPSGNPQGNSYVEVGNEYEKTPYVKPQPKSDPQAIDNALQKAIARYEAGERVKP